MARVLIAGLAVLILGAVALVGYSAQSQAQSVTPTETPVASVSATATAAPSVSATATVSASASVAATVSTGSGTATATPRAQPAAVPVTGGNPSDGSPNLLLILAIALGAVAATGGVLAASYGLTRRS